MDWQFSVILRTNQDEDTHFECVCLCVIMLPDFRSSNKNSFISFWSRFLATALSNLPQETLVFRILILDQMGLLLCCISMSLIVVHCQFFCLLHPHTESLSFVLCQTNEYILVAISLQYGFLIVYYITLPLVNF